LHRLLFWFVIKNVIPRGEGRNLANPMDMCLIDLLDRGEKINLLAIMIHHITRIANTSDDHDMGYGFLLTSVFEQSGITLQKRVSLQHADEIGGNTLIGCGFQVTKGGNTGFKRGFQTPFCPVLKEPSSSSTPTLNTLIQTSSPCKVKLQKSRRPLLKNRS